MPLRPGLGQLAAGAELAGEDVCGCAGACLSAQCAVDQRPALAGPRRLYRRTGAQQNDDVRVDGSHSGQKLLLVLGQLHVRAVEAFALPQLIEAEAEQNGVSLLCEGHSLFQLLGVSCTLTLETGGIAHEGDAAVVGLDAVQQGVHLQGVDGAGACALIAGRLGKVADDGQLLIGLERQDAALVPEQDDALCGRAAGKLMVRGSVEGAGRFFHRSVGGEHQFQHLVEAGVHVGLGNFAVLYGLHQLPDGVAAGTGHFEGGAVFHAEGVVIGAAPVGDDSPVEAPVLPQNVLQQVGILVGVGAVDEVVGGHDGLGLCLFHHDLEAGQIQLPQGALIEHRVAGHAAQLLTVDRKVLGAGRDAVFLDAAHIGSGHPAREDGIFREILEVAAAEGAALDVQAGAEQDSHFLCGGFLAQCLAHGFAQLLIPAARSGGRGREAGCRNAGVEAQMVGGAGLLADSVGAVRKGDGRDALARQSPGGKDSLAREQSAFLL